jgi:hypothetical protein
MSSSRRQDDAGGTEQEGEMAVDGIGRSKIIAIEQLRRMHAARAQEEASAPGAKRAGAADSTGPGTGEAAAAHRAAEARPQTEQEKARLVDQFKSETADLPDVRRDKVIEAKLRISSGYYNRDEIRKEILRSVLANIAPPPPEPTAGAESASGKGEAGPAGPDQD